MHQKTRRIDPLPLQRERGSAVTEFIIVFPTFLLLCMFILEMAFLWADQHIIKLAAFEASRSVALLAENDRRIFKDVTPDGNGARCLPNAQLKNRMAEQNEILGTAKKAAVAKVATISPTLPIFLAQIPGLSGVSNAISGVFSGVTGTTTEDPSAAPLTRSLGKYVASLPTAYILTQVDRVCADAHAVTVAITYQRSPKMPFVGSFLWAVHVGKKLLQESKGTLSLAIDPINQSGLSLAFHGGAMNEQLSAVKPKIKNYIESVLKSSKIDLKSFNIAQVVGVEFIDPLLDRGLDAIFSGVTGVLGAESASILGKMTGLVTSAVYAVPLGLRLIPMSAEARMVTDAPNGQAADAQWNGRALLVAPFDQHDPSSAWARWAARMQDDRGSILKNNKPKVETN